MTLFSKLKSVTCAGAMVALVAGAGGGAMLGAPTAALARAGGESFADLAAQLQPAVVNISTTTKVSMTRGLRSPFPPGHPFEEMFRRFQQEQPGSDGKAGGEGDRPITREAQSLGSGFLISADGLVVTNNHVITGGDSQTVVDKITVILNDGRKFEARVLGRDPATDMALLRITGNNLPFVKIGDSAKLRVGDWVMAIGNPFGLGGTVTAGIVSALHRDIDVGAYDRFIQTDASINRGNSGGPMFNMDGEVVGINTAIFSPSGGNVGIGFAVPSEQALPVIEQLRQAGRVRRGWLGVRIQSVTDDIAAGLGLAKPQGAIVASVEPNAPAARSGLEEGDVILTFDGKAIDRSRSLPSIVSETGIGRTVDLTLLREGKPRTVRITIGEMPSDTVSAADVPRPSGPAQASEGARRSLGLTLTPLTPELRRALKLEEKVEGVVVASVSPSSDAASKGLRRGDLLLAINQRKVNSPDMAAKIVEEARKNGRDAVVLLLQRDGDTFNFGVRMAPEELK